jgi:hypothetical protein
MFVTISEPHLVEQNSAGHVVQHREKQDKACGGLFLKRGAGGRHVTQKMVMRTDDKLDATGAK